jgi:endogenous inhibitor of DNA gyrase (YacG/DUF329 family)
MTGPSPQTPRCSVCGKPRETEAYRPFCSKRCADVDLQRWLSNRYVVPGRPLEEGGAGVFDEDEQAE